MRVVPTEIDDVLILEIKIFRDHRGFFAELYNCDTFGALNLPRKFEQVNYSRSKAGVLRGLHYQSDPPQGKLVAVLAGRAFDVAVDLRPESSSFGRHVAVKLSADSGKLLWIPPQFAHGFCCIDHEGCDLVYLTTGAYNKGSEGGIRWNDVDLNIEWPISRPIVSERDSQLPTFQEFRAGLNRS